MKRLLAIGAVSVLGALMIGSAAALTVNGGSIQAGSDVTLECDADGVDVSYTTSFVAGNFVITDVTVSGINALCDGRQLDVVLTQGGSSVATGTVASLTGPSQAVNTADVNAAIVDDVHVAIH